VPANPTGAADPADEAEPLTTGQDDGNEPEVTDPADEAEPLTTGQDDGNEPEVTDPVEESEPTDDPGSDQYLADLQRVSAEFANFRKQANRRNAEATTRALADLAGRLLPILDACDAAISQGADDVVAIRKAVLDALEPVGLEVLDPNGDPFDPTLHEAVAHEPADKADDAPEVVEVVRRGYVWAGRVIRPAMVRVRG
ncbi:uncharacterized protein METZ01_LOCUS55362, partial [marine metagenome]